MLEDLLNLIMSNLFFVILIVGAIYNFLRRMGGQQQQQNQSPSTGTAPTEEKRTQLKDIFQQFEEAFKDEEEVARPTPKTPAVESNPQSHEMLQRYERIKETKPAADIPYGTRNIKTVSGQSKPKKSSSRISKNNAAQGVIWAEILGPPRAKRTLYSQRLIQKPTVEYKKQ
ncbi:hypothetical protein [Litchfieldia alkalitelluris]|uniref:hypothetical protein n=1 Tax=Litchfieldia alkalitelluris TaxID=304268 RepID=UPI000997354B|nr:hypothetical protein [Litchfieldia alkalitelluris]